jgi:predicted ester cyclase
MTDVKETLHRIFDEVINHGKLEVIDELFADDYLDHGPTGDLPGRDAFKQTVEAWLQAVPDVHCEVRNVVTDGEWAGWLVYTTGTHTGDQLGFPATGTSFSTVSANMGRMVDGRAVEHWSEQGMLPMLVQLGIFAPPAP